MSTKSDLLSSIRDMSETHAKMMLIMAKGLNKLGNVENDDSDLPAPRRPGRPKKNNSENSAKRGRGRPRKVVENDDEEKPARGKNAKRGRGRPRNEDSESTSTKRGGKKPAPAARTSTRNSGSTDYSDMSKSELRAAADKINLNLKAAKIAENKVASTLAAIDKLANNSKSVEAIEKLASRAGVELSFGRGRPPSDDAGKKRRIIVKMMNEGESPL